MAKFRIQKNWFTYWVVLSILAPLISFGAGYGFLFAFALFYPLAQTIALYKIPTIRLPWIWMLHTFYGFFLLLYGYKWEYGWMGIFLLPVIGQLLLFVIFKGFGRFNYLIFNTLGIASLLLIYWLISVADIRIDNDFLEIVLVITMFFSTAYLPALGIKRGYLQENHQLSNSENSES